MSASPAQPTPSVALIVGAGPGLSAALARRFAHAGARVALAARRPDRLHALKMELDARAYACDAADADSVAALFADVEADLGAPDVVVYNAGYRAPGPITDLEPEAVARSLDVNAFGAFLVAQQAARRMVPAGRGAILFTGASASVKGFPRSSAFAMGKFALRGLAQSLARELHPQGVHVAHMVIDGVIAQTGVEPPQDLAAESLLDPAALAETYYQVLSQPRSAWTWEVELRPWVERF